MNREDTNLVVDMGATKKTSQNFMLTMHLRFMLSSIGYIGNSIIITLQSDGNKAYQKTYT